MTRQNGPRYDEQYLRQGSPTNSTFAESVPFWVCKDNAAIAATGVVLTVAVPLQIGDIATNVTFITATQAAVAPTAGYIAVRSPAGAVVAQSADLGNTARAANTVYKIAMATPYLVTDGGLYLVDISFTAGTVPTLAGVALHNATLNGAIGLSKPIYSQTHGSAVGATPPATIATPTTVKEIPYVVVT